MEKAKPYSRQQLAGTRSQRIFEGQDLLQIAMPLGGLGAGCICLNGQGGLQDFSIRNQPATSGVADGHGTTDAAFALLHIKGKEPVTKLVEGPMPVEKKYNLGTKAQGFREGGHEGLPRFAKAVFTGEYPFGKVKLTDPDIPLRVGITGFNPFIPLDQINSGIPCAILEYTIENRSKARVDYELSYHLSHLAGGSDRGERSTRNQIIPGGVHLYNVEPEGTQQAGSASLTVIGHRPAVKAMWFRGGWFDATSALWREVSSASFKSNKGTDAQDCSGRNGGSILLKGSLKPGERVTYPIVITWHFPNCHYGSGADKPVWRPFYASQWDDAAAAAAYVRKHFSSLRTRTQAFHDALFKSTLPSYVLDAVSANLAILKSPTLLLQESGNAWGWEGCFVSHGCCAGTCTHVWNYAQALPHLFPHLERTFRETELERSMDRRGHMTFRSTLPDGEAKHQFHAASDGQLGGIMKVYREWQISADEGWLKRMYPLVKRSIDYCIRTWDPKGRGVLEEPHHNTYDIEFWGPDGMCTSFYLGALAAMVELSKDAGKPGHAERYEKLAEKGAAYLDRHLWNGSYYEQRVTYRGLKDKSFARLVDKVTTSSGEVDKLLKREGPKYQYGSGCISDGVIGSWMAAIYGIDSPLNRRHVRRNLKAIFEHNFKPDLSNHACSQRPGYAWGKEAGLLLCSWPRGGKPTLPFVYSDEVWTGIEYQVASHLIEEGLVDEGLTIVKGARDRYNGHVRNPWNEYECGNYYARALASYALLGSLSGFRYSHAKRTLWLAPKLPESPFTTFFSCATGFGTVTLTESALSFDVVEGELAVETIELRVNGKRRRIREDIRAVAGKRVSVKL
jgi:uncharacterized protein (DUF608 family)